MFSAGLLTIRTRCRGHYAIFVIDLGPKYIPSYSFRGPARLAIPILVYELDKRYPEASRSPQTIRTSA
ncbi:hypothetical protein ABKN59_008046 [Abortiporus biennis]